MGGFAADLGAEVLVERGVAHADLIADDLRLDEDDEFFADGVVGVGAEEFSKAGNAAKDGQALFVGPTIAWAARENIIVNAAFLPQIAGKARGASGPLDLDGFNRANYRLKIAIGF